MAEKAVATHSSTLAWRIPWTEGPGGLQSMGSLGVGHDWATSLSRIGEGNGNPLQCSCLENPREEGAWWATVYGVAQSRTRLKRLSSSSSSVFIFCLLLFLIIQSRSCLSLTEVILYCLLQSLMMLRELEKKWNMSGGRRDIFIWTFQIGLNEYILYCFYFLPNLKSFQVLHLPFVSLVSPWPLFITAEHRCSWTENWVVSVQPCHMSNSQGNGKGYVFEVCLLAMSWLKAFLIMPLNYHLLSSQVEKHTAVSELIHVLPLSFCKLSALSVLWERGVLETGRWEMHPKGLVRKTDASGLLNGYVFTFVNTFMLVPLISVRLPRR